MKRSDEMRLAAHGQWLLAETARAGGDKKDARYWAREHVKMRTAMRALAKQEKKP